MRVRFNMKTSLGVNGVLFSSFLKHFQKYGNSSRKQKKTKVATEPEDKWVFTLLRDMSCSIRALVTLMNQDISICVGVVAKKNKIVFHSLNFQLKRLAYTTTDHNI